MNTQPVGYKAKAFEAHNLIFYFLLVLLLTACASSAPTLQPPTPLPAKQTDPAHAPVILRVEERTGNDGEYWLLSHNIYFMDPDGDATTVVKKLISTDPAGIEFPYFRDQTISSDESAQKHEASASSEHLCRQVLSPYSLTLEYRIRDSTGNLSAPVMVAFSCPANPSNNTPLIYSALVIALVLLVGFWLTFRRRPDERILALQSTLLLYFSLITSNFMGTTLHEGGHALANLLQGGTVTLFYVHPFPFSGYVRPFVDSVLAHVLGYGVGTLLPLLIFILIWKRRSISTLPLIMLFAFGAILDGMTMSSGGYDVANLVRLTGLPVSLFTATSILLFIAGIFFMMSVFPLLGLAPENRKSLLVIPAAYFIQCVIGLLVAYLCIPGSPADTRHLLGSDLIMTAHMGTVIFPIVGLIFTVIYVTLYRLIYRKLPAGLRTEVVSLTWKDLRTPAVLAAICVILGLIIIT
jgi:hypothetical protein